MPDDLWPAELDRMERAQSEEADPLGLSQSEIAAIKAEIAFVNRAQAGGPYAVLDRPAAPKRLTAEQIAELREMAASQFMIPVIEKPVLAALLDAYEKMYP